MTEMVSKLEDIYKIEFENSTKIVSMIFYVTERVEYERVRQRTRWKLIR